MYISVHFLRTNPHSFCPNECWVDCSFFIIFIIFFIIIASIFQPLQSACSVPSLLQTQSLPNLVSNKHQQWLLRNKLLALNSSINAAEKAFGKLSNLKPKLCPFKSSMSHVLSIFWIFCCPMLRYWWLAWVAYVFSL